MKILKSFILFILFVIVCLGLSINNNFFPYLDGDGFSLVVMAKAPLIGIGSAYKNFWEYKPPGIFLLVGLWIKIFTSSMFSLRILGLLLMFGSGILGYLSLRKVFSSFYSFVVASLGVLVLFSPYLQRAVLPSEIFGLFFSLSGLVILLHLKDIRWRFFLSTFFFLFAGQMKDPFGFTILALLPPLVYLLMSRDFKSFGKAVMFAAAGLLTAILLIVGYLSILGSLDAYREVLMAKSRIFNGSILLKCGETLSRFMASFWKAKNIIIFFQYQTIPFLFFWLISFLLSLFWRKKLRFSIKKDNQRAGLTVIPTFKLEFFQKTINILTVIFYSLGSFLGFAVANLFDFHYLIQIIFPLFFFLSIFIKSTLDNFQKILGKRMVDILLLPLLIVFLFPKGPYLKSYRPADYHPQKIMEQIYHNVTAPDQKTILEDYLNSKTKEADCILSVYGWGSGETYMDARRRPCTRFFLANIVVENWQKKEYRESLWQNPPQAIVYNSEWADMNVQLFEKEVINLTRIIDHCYELNSSSFTNLYFPRYSGDQLKTCLKENST